MELDKTIAFLFSHRRVNYDTGCWEWTGHCGAAGYGRISTGRSRTLGEGFAHRLSARVFLGLGDHDPRFVLHICDNPPCFNYTHLRLGTAADNGRDMAAKGRAHRGNTKLTWPQVKTIRGLATSASNRDLAKRYAVTEATIGFVLRNKTWVDPMYTPILREQPSKLGKGPAPRLPRAYLKMPGEIHQGVLFAP